ncbi:MAG: hypothetical protein JNK82_21010 [Myxococcaceae bacterium]|nr:hypothetical protein [Myxococcaceae bacterium]
MKVAVDQFNPAPAPQVTPPPPPPPADPARGLSPEQRTRLNDALSGKNGPQAQAAAQALSAQAAVLPDDARLKVLNLATRDLAGADGQNLMKLFTSPAWLSATPDQKRQLLDVASVAGPKGLESLAKLSGDSKLLNDRDANGKSLLDNLALLSNQQLNPAIVKANDAHAANPVTRQRLVDSVLTATANPAGSIKQGSFDTCVPTSMEFELARSNPSEYARLVGGLSSESGKVTTKGGATLELQTDYLDQVNKGDDRLASSVLFQNAAMEHANGADNYVEDLDQHFQAGETDFSKAGRRGLKRDEQAVLGKALFGREYTSVGVDVNNASQVLTELKKYPSNPPVVLSFKQDGKLNHACTLQKIENGRVYFRNPVGAADSDAMKTWAKRGAKVENAANGEWSMSEADFKKHVASVAGPSNPD